MITQLEMPLTKAPKPSKYDVEVLKSLCRVHSSGWLTALDIADLLNMSLNESSKRLIRAWADAAAPEIISGQEGYRHIAHATAEEIWHSIHWMESQAGKMQERAIAYRRRGYELGKL